MKVLMVGAGVIGTLYGSVLAKKHQVVHLVREEKLDKLNEKRITYDIIDERKDKKHQKTEGSYTYHCTAKADDSYDLIMVPVKTIQLMEVLRMIVSQAPSAKYLLFTLDWHFSDEIERLLKKDQYVMGYAGGGGTFKGELLWANVGADIMLGAVHKEQQALLESVVSLFKSCDIIPEVQKNPLHWLWVHNAGAAPFGAALAKYNSMPEFLRDKALLKTTLKATRECYAVCEKRGVDLKQFWEPKMFRLPIGILYHMFKYNFEKNPIMQRYTAHAVSSIDEMTENFLDIFKTGEELGISMPSMQRLKEIIE